MRLEPVSGEDAALSVSWIERPDALAALAPAWDALCDACPRATPFVRPGWALRAGLEGAASLSVIAIHRGSALAGVLPLAALASEPRTWVIAGTGPSDVLDVVARPSDELDVARAALRAIARRPGWDALELHELREGSPLRAAAHEGLAGRLAVDDRLCVAPVLEWPAGAASLDDVLSPSWARRVRYDRRRAAREGFAVEVATGAGREVDEAIDAWRRNHESRWTARGAAGLLAQRPGVGEAVRSLAAEHRAELVSLRASGALRASYVILRERAWAGLYLGGFDPAIARASPLVVLLAETFERLAREGVRELDFLRGGEPYKYAWGARDREQRRVRLERE